MILIGINEGDSFLPDLKAALESRYSTGSSTAEIQYYPIERKRFDDGEARFRLTAGTGDGSPESTLKAADQIVYVVRGSYGNEWRPFEMFGQTLFVLDKLAEYGVNPKRICVVVPCQPFAKQDQPFRHGEAVSLRSYRNMAGTRSGLLVNVSVHDHRGEGWIGPNIFNVDAAPLVLEHLESLGLKNPLVVLPDGGSKDLGSYIADRMHADSVILRKDRDRETGALTFHFPQYMDERALALYNEAVYADDIIGTGRTLRLANQPAVAAELEVVNEGIHCICVPTGIRDDDPSKPDALKPYILDLVNRPDDPEAADEVREKMAAIKKEFARTERVPSLEMLQDVSAVYGSNSVNSRVCAYSVVDLLADAVAAQFK